MSSGFFPHVIVRIWAIISLALFSFIPSQLTWFRRPKISGRNGTVINIITLNSSAQWFRPSWYVYIVLLKDTISVLKNSVDNVIEYLIRVICRLLRLLKITIRFKSWKRTRKIEFLTWWCFKFFLLPYESLIFSHLHLNCSKFGTGRLPILRSFFMVDI